MNKRAIFRSLLFLSLCCMLTTMIFVFTLGHRWDNYTIYILHNTSQYHRIRRQRFGSNSTMNASHCLDSPRIRNTTRETGPICNYTEGKRLQDVTAKIPMSRSRKSEYLLLDSNKDSELDLHCRQCALVFSSGHLLGSNMGREIDRAECVIRQNMATVRNHVQDVGMRTTARVIGHSNFKKDLLTPRQGQTEILHSPQTRPAVIYIPWLYKESIDRTTHNVFQIARAFSQRFPKVKFFFQSDEMIRDMDGMFMEETGLNRTEIETWFSTGFMSVLFALDVCEKVICYGVSDADYCRREPTSQVSYHYYDTTKDHLLECSYINERENMVKGGHKFLTERKLYARWAQYRNLTFRAPKWPKSAFNVSGEFESPYLSVYRKAKEDGSFSTNARPVNNLKPLANDKVRRPLLRRFRVIRRQVPPHLLKKKGTADDSKLTAEV